jgi:hypothetical protein
MVKMATDLPGPTTAAEKAVEVFPAISYGIEI